MLNNKTILITGGTGSFGKKFTETDSLYTFDLGKYYAILLTISGRPTKEDYLRHNNIFASTYLLT